MENNILALKTYVDGGIGDTPFPNAEGQIEIGAFRYDAKRMGGAPTINMSVYYPSCLDNEWTSKVYAEFNGERYFLKQTPTSSYSNEDARYKHEVELVAERKILDDTYFYDTVVGNPQENDKPVSNDTNFNFYGNIVEFAKRMNASLQYTKLQKINNDESIQGYYVVVDEGITTEDKHISFDGAVFSQALQESYNTFGIPFYFVGKEIHLGFTNNAISGVLEYGVDDALLSITKQNSNFKVVNRASGKGSTENIPYYYPNNSPKGDIEAVLNTSSEDFSINVFDMDLFSNGLNIDSSIKYNEPTAQITNVVNKNSEDLVFVYTGHTSTCRIFTDAYRDTKADFVLNLNIDLSRYYWEWGSSDKKIWKKADEEVTGTTTIRIYNKAGALVQKLSEIQDAELVLDIPKGDSYFDVVINFIPAHYEDKDDEFRGSIILDAYLNTIIAGWYKDERRINLSDIGIVGYNSPSIDDTITQRLVKHVKTSQSLMPSIYRATDGEERFYNAVNYPFDYVDGYELKYAEYLGEDGKVHNDLYKKDDGTYMVFENPYVEGNPKEHVFSVDDLMPTIKGMTNDVFWQDTDENGQAVNVYQRIDMFSEFAYDEGDNDETYTTEDGGVAFKHPYFFAKLRKLDFNLFDHAIENGAMTISMTSGNCGACNFEIGVSDGDEQFNPVQVDANGNLVRDDEGRILCGLEDYQGPVQPQPKQQDTINNEVWIALKKEESTYGILMPKAPKYQGETLVEAGHRPKACSSAQSNDGDTFVIININLPEEYILHAERKLEQKIIQYIGENNKEKFNFSITFSRIFLAEHPNFLEQLNENARLTIRYNNAEYLLYVSSFSYNMGENDVLPEIRVDLDDTLTISQNVLQRAIDSVKSEIGQAINALDVAAIGSRYFLRKDVADVAQEPIDFRKGVFFGDSSDVRMYPDGSAKLTIDYLEVTRKATFTSLEIQEKTHVGGQLLITPAAITCSYVEELEYAYRCYFQTKGANGDEIFNQFAVEDQAICQTFNAWGNKYYWRLVTGIGEDYIDLSKSDCAPESDVPSIGDKIIQLGNRNDRARQAAQVLSSHGENSPSFIMYNGIDSFSLVDKNVTGIIWNPNTQEPQMYSYGSFFFGDRELDGNYITFQRKEGEAKKKLHINATVNFSSDSTGLSNLEDWKKMQDQIDGVVENWNGEGAPLLTSEPTKSWIEKGDAELIAHINDTYINIEAYVDDETTPTAGHAWRWCRCEDSTITDQVGVTDKEGNRFNLHWHPIADSDAVRALKEAAEAKRVSEENVERLNVLYDDGLITQAEKFEFLQEQAFINTDRLEIDNQVQKYELTEHSTYTSYVEAFNGYNGVLNTIITTANDEFPLSVAELGLTFQTNRFYALRSGILQLIANTTKGLIDSAFEEIEKIPDTEYLRNAFKEGTTEIEGGVVMSEIVAVRDSEDSKVEAFLNGSDYASDTEHGKLLIAAGIPDGTTDLEERAKEAATRVYEDGTLKTVKGEFEGNIKANGGEIGRLKITVNPQTKATSLSSATDYCSKGFMESAHLTDGNFGASTSYNDTEGVCKQPYDSTMDGIGLHCRRPFKQESLETYLDDENWERGSADIFIEHGNSFDGSETAIKVNSGMFEGLRPSLYVADTDVWLGNYDHTIIIEKSGITVYLPTRPKVGQRYEIFKHYSGSVNIHPQGVPVYSSGSYGGNNGLGTNVTTLGTGGFARAVYIYTGSYWFRTVENYD